MPGVTGVGPTEDPQGTEGDPPARLALGLAHLDEAIAPELESLKTQHAALQAEETKLTEAGVTSVGDLLEKGATPKGREELAAKGRPARGLVSFGVARALVVDGPAVEIAGTVHLAVEFP